MANIIIENADQILERVTTQLKQNTQLTRITPGSKVRTLMGIMAAEIERLEEIVTANTVLGLVGGANGVYLDFIGELVGVKRGQQTTAMVSSDMQIVRLFVEDGSTFGAINNNLPVTIPSGTIISSADGQIRYATIYSLTLDPASTETFISIRALKPGVNSNIGKGVLTRIQFESYASFPRKKLAVENLSSIESGAEQESDTFFRYRIQNAILGSEAANYTAVRLAALSVQSVADVVILELYRGIGTADILLDTETGAVSTATLEAVRIAVANVAALGMDIRVRAPQLAGLEVALDVKYSRGLSAPEKLQVNKNIRQAIADIVSTTSLGGTLVINSIVAAVLKSDTRIMDIGAPNAPLTEVNVWRPSILTNTRRPTPIKNANFSLLADERLTLEGSITEAIRIIEK